MPVSWRMLVSNFESLGKTLRWIAVTPPTPVVSLLPKVILLVGGKESLPALSRRPLVLPGRVRSKDFAMLFDARSEPARK